MGLNKTSVAGKSRCATSARGGPAQVRLPGGCATARKTHARPRSPASGGPGPLMAPTSRETPGPASRRGPGGTAELESAEDVNGGAAHETGASRFGGVGSGGYPDEGMAGTPPPTPGRRPREWSQSPRPEVGAPLALLPYLPRGLRSPLFGRPQP